jgi:hypothetical protein
MSTTLGGYGKSHNAPEGVSRREMTSESMPSSEYNMPSAAVAAKVSALDKEHEANSDLLTARPGFYVDVLAREAGNPIVPFSAFA